MKVLLTGASGFVGSHILDSLSLAGLECALLLRSSSDKSFIEGHLRSVEVRLGSIGEPESLDQALKGITHVIHCAGCTRAKRTSDYYENNHLGTKNLIEAVNKRGDAVERFLHISSLAVTGPATAERPAREDDPLNPVSDYGKSKLKAEMEVRAQCRVPYTILRPPAVYGPRDKGFLTMFKAVDWHLLPKPSERQSLSLVFVKDLAEAVIKCLNHPKAAGRTYFVSSSEVVTGSMLAGEIGRTMKRWTIPFPLPAAMLWPICLLLEATSRLTGRATLMNLQKFAELRAPGWVCDASLLADEVGYRCRTTIHEGVAATLEWYKQNHWL